MSGEHEIPDNYSTQSDISTWFTLHTISLRS